MSTERHADLKQHCYEKREDIRRLEEEIRKLEEKICTPKEANETSEPSQDKKSSREPRKHTAREPSPIPATSYDHEAKQIRSSEKRSPDQGSIDKVYTTIKVYANQNSNFSFKISNPLSIIWDECRRNLF